MSLELVDARMIQTVPQELGAILLVEVTAPVRKRCPFREEADEGTVTIGWSTAAEYTIELHSLRAYLDQFADLKLSHEQFTDEVRAAVRGALADEAEVKSTWATAGMNVTVSS